MVARYLKHLNYWNDLPYPYNDQPLPRFEEPDGIPWNQDFQKYLSNIRINLLVPELNLTELSNPYLLFSLIHERGRFHPSYFAQADNDATYLGRQTRLLSGIFTELFMVSFSDQPQPVSVQSPAESADNVEESTGSAERQTWTGSYFEHYPAWMSGGSLMEDQQRQRFERLRQEGNVFAPAEAWIIIQRQMYMLTFLVSFVDQIFTKHAEPGNLLVSTDARLECFVTATKQIKGPIKENMPTKSLNFCRLRLT